MESSDKVSLTASCKKKLADSDPASYRIDTIHKAEVPVADDLPVPR